MSEQTAAPIDFTLGDRLRKARVRAGLDQTELAQRIAVSRGTVSNYELGRGKRPPKTLVLRAWAHECGVTYDELVAAATASASGRITGRFSSAMVA